MKILHYIFLTLTILWLAVIFIFSSQTGDISSNTSGAIVDIIVSIFIPDFEEYSLTQQQDISDTVSFIVRKGAHFAEYAILGLLSFLTAMTYIWKKMLSCSIDELHMVFCVKRMKCGIVSLIFACTYAITDELHQGFVADRSPALRDICIDSCGAFIGILFVCFSLSIYFKKKESRS